MMTTFAPAFGFTENVKQACNCHYPIGLVIFLVFTILTLFICICVCCVDITKCSFCKRKESTKSMRKLTAFDPRFMDSTKFIVDRKLSLDPRLLEYSQLLNCGSSSSSSQASNLVYSNENSLVTTV